jgi:membrane fusion protein, multidrug efflux system
MRKTMVILALGAALVAAALYKAYDYYVYGRFLVSTDDAYVRADMAAIAAKISGYLASVDVGENQAVRKGDLLARIDPGDFQLAVAAARDRIATQDATIQRIRNQIEAQRNAVAQANAQLAGARADSSRAQNDFKRAEALVREAFVSRQRLDHTTADRDRTEANIAAARAALALAESNLHVLETQKIEAERVRAELNTALSRAERDLSFTEIRAPFDGVVGAKSAQRGQFVQPAGRLLTLVALGSVFIEANFKETQLARLQPGQKATILVDACPDCSVEGRIESFAPASGSQFSLLPPENATGNFTKIVQRLSVRIGLDGAAPRSALLRPGLSVIVEVDTRASPAIERQAAR